MNNDLSPLAEATRVVKDWIDKDRGQSKIEGVGSDLHPLAPFVPADIWQGLGNEICKREHNPPPQIPGECWISIRCDGSSFGKLIKTLRKNGILTERYSNVFGEIMVECCKSLMMKMTAKCGFTQSDEMTVLIAPASCKNGVQQSHAYNGRVQKLCSQSASVVTATFYRELVRHCNENDKTLPEDVLPMFDCRIGSFQTKQEALSLFLWRAYDCSRNGVSDACLQQKAPKRFQGETTTTKLQWLNNRGLLPLPRHQREGTYLVKRKRKFMATNRKTGNAVQCLRSRIEHVEGNVIVMCKENKLFPPDEELDPGKEPSN